MKRSTRFALLGVFGTLTAVGAVGACVNSIEPPPLLPQGLITYGPRVYVVAPNTSTNPDVQTNGVCSRLTELLDDSNLPKSNASGTRATTAVTLEQAYAELSVTDGRDPLDADSRELPTNCFIPMQGSAERRLSVDAFEVTNDLYQVCRDSEFCRTPDPSQADKNDICVAEDDTFFQCPVVQPTRQDADEFCEFIGRRLPTALEAIIIRQQGWSANPDGTRSPESFRRFPASGSDALSSCEDAHLGYEAAPCGRPTTLSVDDPFQGAAANDVVTAETSSRATSNALYDLTGHVAEWVVDGFSTNRQLPGLADDLPWFCLSVVTQNQTTGEPVCPEPPDNPNGPPFDPLPCVYGYYDPNEVPANFLGLDEGLLMGNDLPFGLYPVCLTSPTGRFAGSRVGLFGGTWRDGNDERAGVYDLRIERNPDEIDSSNLETYGIRCVDDINDEGTDFRYGDLPIDNTFDPN